MLEDIFFPDSLRLDSEAVFAARRDTEDFVDYEFRLYKGMFTDRILKTRWWWVTLLGTAHGFATRPNQNIPEIKVAYEGALDQAVNWFQKTLNVN